MKRLVFGAGVALTLAACTVMSGLHLPTGTVDQPLEGSPGVLPDGSAEGSSGAGFDAGCKLRHPNVKPATKQPDGAITITVAVSEIKGTNGGEPYGYDLDGLCTCGSSGALARPACKTSGKPFCDFNASVDNAGSSLFEQMKANNINTVDDTNARIRSGNEGHLIRVQNYNGQKDDDDVTVTFLNSPGLGEPLNTNTVQSWPIKSTDVKSNIGGELVGQIADAHGWFADGQLVAHFDTIVLPLVETNAVPTKMTNAVLTAQLGTAKDV